MSCLHRAFISLCIFTFLWAFFYPHPLNAMCFPHSFPPTGVIIRMECSSGPWAWDLSKKTEVLEAVHILLWKIAFHASANGQFISCTMWLKWIIENKISPRYLSKNHAKRLHRSGFLLIYLRTHGLRMADKCWLHLYYIWKLFDFNLEKNHFFIRDLSTYFGPSSCLSVWGTKMNRKEGSSHPPFETGLLQQPFV